MATYFKIVAAALLSACILACSEKTNPIDAALPPGTFNLSTVITDSEGNSLDLAGDWAVFTDPDETRFTNYLHFEQDRQLTYSVLDNQIYMVDVDQGKRSLPVYDNGLVSEPRNVFLFRLERKLIYKDGRVHTDFREVYSLYHTVYGDPDLIIVLDENTIAYEDLPGTRLRRIVAFQE